MCMFRDDWLLWIRSPIQRLVPGEDWISLTKGRALWNFRIHSGMSIGIVIFQVLFRNPYCWDLMGAEYLSYIQEIILQQSRCPGPLALNVFPPLLHGVLSGAWRSCIEDVSVAVGNPIESCSLNFDQLGLNDLWLLKKKGCFVFIFCLFVFFNVMRATLLCE